MAQYVNIVSLSLVGRNLRKASKIHAEIAGSLPLDCVFEVLYVVDAFCLPCLSSVTLCGKIDRKLDILFQSHLTF